MASRIQLTRDQLAKFLPDHQAIKVFEQLMDGVGNTIPADIVLLFLLAQEAIIGEGLAEAGANEALAQLARIADGLDLISKAPVPLQVVVLPANITGILDEPHGGTNQSSYVLGDIIYSSAANVLSKLPGNTVATRKFLRQTGTGAISAAPVWDTILAADVPGSALTKVDDTNVTLTLGGTPASALLAAASITVGWAGQLATGRGGTGVSAASIGTGGVALSVEGNWTPTDASGAGLALTTVADGCYYRRVGNVMFAFFDITYPVTADASVASIGSLPTAAKAGTNAVGGGYFSLQTVTASDFGILVNPGASTMIFNTNGGVTIAHNAAMSTKTIRGCAIYAVA